MPLKSRSTHPIRQRDTSKTATVAFAPAPNSCLPQQHSPMRSGKPSSDFLSKGKTRFPPPSPSAAVSDRFDQTSVGRKRPEHVTYMTLMSQRPKSAKVVDPDVHFGDMRPLYEARRRSRSASQAGARNPSATDGSRLETQYSGLLHDLEALERLAETSTGRLSRGRASSLNRSRRESRADQPPPPPSLARQQHHILVEADGDMEDDDLFTWHVPEDDKLKAWMWGVTKQPVVGIRAVSSPTIMASRLSRDQTAVAHPRSESKFKDQESMPSLSPLHLRQRAALEQHLARRATAAVVRSSPPAVKTSPPKSIKKSSSPNDKPPLPCQKKTLPSTAPPSPGLTRTRFGGWIETSSIPSVKSPVKKYVPIDLTTMRPLTSPAKTSTLRPSPPASTERERDVIAAASVTSSCSELIATSTLINPRRANDECFDVSHPDTRLLPLPIDSSLIPLHKHTVSDKSQGGKRSLTPPRSLSPLIAKTVTPSDDSNRSPQPLTTVPDHPQLHQSPEDNISQEQHPRPPEDNISQEQHPRPAASAFVIETANVDDVILTPPEEGVAMHVPPISDQEALDLVKYRMTLDSEVAYYRHTQGDIDVEALPAESSQVEVEQVSSVSEAGSSQPTPQAGSSQPIPSPSKRSNSAPYRFGRKIWNALGRKKKEGQVDKEAKVHQEPPESREAASKDSSFVSPVKKESLCLANTTSKAVGDAEETKKGVRSWTKWVREKGKRVFG